MILKKLFLLYFIVYYCVIVDVKYSFGCQESTCIENENENVTVNIVFLKNNVDAKTTEINNKRRGKWKVKKKLKSKKRNNKRKGRTILILEDNKFVRYKRVRLLKAYRKKLYTVREKVQNVFNNLYFLKKFKRKINFCIDYLSNVKLTKLRPNYESDKSVRRKTIKKTLLRGNVEINPGPISK